ncbi:MAG: hypothetical protein IJ412_07885 [Oscillospiraceae bacterium]|nr:hypothetical protein [Oscillospiraceae bacterium]
MIKFQKQEIILFAGDSITDGGRGLSMDMNHIMGHGFQEHIAGRLAADNLEMQPLFVNKGVSGDTSQKVYSRWAKDVLVYKPTVINLLVGINDISHNLAMPAEQALRKYVNTVEMILQDTFALLPEVSFFLCEPFWMDIREKQYEGIPHPVCEADFPYGSKRTEEEKLEYRRRVAMMQQALPALAAKYNVTYVPFQDLFDEGAKKVPASYLNWDGVHPTVVGHQLMADRWLHIAETVL